MDYWLLFVDSWEPAYFHCRILKKFRNLWHLNNKEGKWKSMLQWGFVGSCLRKVRPVGPSRTVTSLMTAAFSSQKVTGLLPGRRESTGLDGVTSAQVKVAAPSNEVSRLRGPHAVPRSWLPGLMSISSNRKNLFWEVQPAQVKRY